MANRVSSRYEVAEIDIGGIRCMPNKLYSSCFGFEEAAVGYSEWPLCHRFL
jgi:hypothetical protein